MFCGMELVLDQLQHSVHDDVGPAGAAALIDQGLGDFNDAAAPLHEVQPLSCFVHDAAGQLLGGAVGRSWGACCELQQLWVHAAWRRRGVGSALVRQFEARAGECGCNLFYLETFNFQAPALYRGLGWEVALANDFYPHGIVKYTLHKVVRQNAPAGTS